MTGRVLREAWNHGQWVNRPDARVCRRWPDTCLPAHRSWHQSRTQPYSLFIGIGLEPGSTGVDLAPASYEVGLEPGPMEVSLKRGILGVVWHQEPPGQTYSLCGSLKHQSTRAGLETGLWERAQRLSAVQSAPGSTGIHWERNKPASVGAGHQGGW